MRVLQGLCAGVVASSWAAAIAHGVWTPKHGGLMSDEGLVGQEAVYFAYSSRVKALLDAGVRIEELSPTLSARRHRLGVFGQQGALHMKNAIVDDREVFLGSMNLDPRSARLNTELGIIIESPEMAAQLNGFADAGSWYRLRRAPGSGEIEWLRVEGSREIVLQHPPETSAWQRFKLQLLGPFVPERDL